MFGIVFGERGTSDGGVPTDLGIPGMVINSYSSWSSSRPGPGPGSKLWGGEIEAEGPFFNRTGGSIGEGRKGRMRKELRKMEVQLFAPISKETRKTCVKSCPAIALRKMFSKSNLIRGNLVYERLVRVLVEKDGGFVFGMVSEEA